MSIDWSDRLRFFPTLRDYQRRWLPRDLLAGLTFAAVTMPGQIATAHLAGMPPITGWYGFLAACLFAVAIASNRQLALGVDSTVAPMLAAGIIGIGVARGSPEYIGLAIATTFIVGVLILIIGMGNMGWFGDFLSKPVVIGFLGGIAVIIIVDQIPGLLGVEDGSGRTVTRLIDVSGRLGHANPTTVVIGLSSLAALLVFARISRRFPGALVVLTVATIAVTVFDLTDRGIAVLGQLPTGLPSIALPSLQLGTIEPVVGTAVAITLICLAQTAATTRSAAAVGGFETDLNADFRSLGGANILSSLFGSFTIDASPPSTQIIAESRGRTQLVSLVAAVIAVLMLFWSSLVANLPTATLSAVLIYIGIKIFRVDEMRATWRYSWRAFALMLTTLLGVVLLGIVYGVALAVIISFADRTRRTARPELLRLGRLPNGHWFPENRRTREVPGVTAFLLNGPLWFGNANWFRVEMINAIPEGPDKPRMLLVDATRMDDIDFSGAEVVLELHEICKLRGVRFAMASHEGRARREFDSGGLMSDLGPDAFYDTLDEAVASLPDDDSSSA